MALATKYRSEFKDILQLSWKADFEIEGWGGSIEDMEPTDNPVSIEFLSSSDDLHQDPIRGSKASIGIYSQTHFQYKEFFDADDLGIRFSLYWETNLYWRGFILPGDYSESYNGVAYPVLLSASDGLGLLNNILFDDSGEYYTGRKTAAEIIFLILSKINFTGFTEYINIYEEHFAYSVNDSPLDQDFIDCDLFQDKYCYEVLSIILNDFNAIIRQKDGGFIIYRPDDLYQTTIYGRIFTSATAKSSTSKGNLYFIDRKANPSGFADIEGGQMNIKRSAKKITFNQDYGYKDSWIKNWKLLGNTYDMIAEAFDNWVAGSGWSRITIAGYPDGMVLYSGSSVPPNYPWHEQSFGAYAIASSDVFIFSFDYQFFNYTGSAKTMTFYLRIKSDNGDKWLYIIDEDEAGWSNTAADFTFTDVADPGKSDSRTIERKINGIPLDGSYTISLYCLHDSGGAACYTIVNNFKFIATSDQLSVIRTPKPTWFERFIFGKMGSRIREAKKHPRIVNYKDVEEIALKTYVKTNPNNGADVEFDFLLGDVDDANIDNILEQLQGSTSYFIEGSEEIPAEPQISVCDILTGTYNSFDITAKGVTRTVNFNTSIAETARIFCENSANIAAFAAVDLTLTRYDDFVGIQLESEPGTANSFTLTAGNNLGDFTWNIFNDNEAVDLIPAVADVYAGTAIWNSRDPGGEEKALLDLISDELKLQFSRTREIIQLPILENLKNGNYPQVDISGCFIDSLNLHDSEIRYFAFNRGVFDVRNRSWEMDLIEIVPIPEEA